MSSHAPVGMTGVRVAVIGGGAAAAALAAALTGAGYEVESLAVDCEGDLAGAVTVLQSCAVALPALPDGGAAATLAGLCDLAGVPWVGSGVRASALAMDRWATKLVADSIGVRTPCGTLVTRGEVRQVVDLLVADLPMVVTPVSTGSGQSTRLARTRDQLVAALEAAFALDDRVVVAEVLAGRQVEIAVLGRPDGRRMVSAIFDESGDLDVDAAYDGAARFQVPAALPEFRRKQLEEAAVAMYDALGCAGVARVAFVLTEAGPVLREVNTAPALTERSPVARMFAAAGISYAELVDLLVRDAWLSGATPVLAGGPDLLARR